MLGNEILNITKSNKRALLIGWIGLLGASIPRYVDTHNFSEVLYIWIIGALSFAAPTILYFIKKDSTFIKYIINASVYSAIFAVIYQQQGAIGGSYLLCIVVAFTSIYFDRWLTLFSTGLGTTITIILYATGKQMFFPGLSIADVSELCIGLIITGLFVFFQAELGRRIIITIMKREEEALKLNDRFTNILDNTVQTSNMLDKSIEKLSYDAKVTKSEINQITLSIQQASKSLENQASNASDSIQLLSLIEDVIKGVTKKSEDMTESSNFAFKAAEGGKNIVNELVKQIHVIDDTVKSASNTIFDLNNQSKEINKIASLINGVASQITLLALNAAIEAARAGEQGKGFAVVANEIKNLASQTSTAVKDISQILDYITQKISNVTQQIDIGNQAVEKGMGITDTTYECFIDIIDRVNNITKIAEKLGEDVVHLSKESIEVFNSIKGIGDMTKNSSSTIQEVSVSTLKQNERVDHIEELVSELVAQSKSLKSLITQVEK